MVFPDQWVEEPIDEMIEDYQLDVINWGHDQAAHAVAYLAGYLLENFTEPVSIHIDPQKRTVLFGTVGRSPERLEGASPLLPRCQK